MRLVGELITNTRHVEIASREASDFVPTVA